MGLGGLLLATATWLLFVLLGVADNLVAVVVLTATVAFVVGATVNWSNLLLRRIFLTTSFVAATFGAGMFADPDHTSTTASAASHWQEFAPLEIARHVSEGHTVFVDVTADWCLTCKANKTLVLDRSPVIDRLSEEAVIYMQADWTRPDQKISRFLERHQRYAIPFNIVFGPRAPAGIALPEVLTPTLVLDALESASNL
jgi:suppressor for copper-sensitivity B